MIFFFNDAVLKQAEKCFSSCCEVSVTPKGQRIQEQRASSLALLLMSWTSRLLASRLLWTEEIFSTPPGPDTRPWHNYREDVKHVGANQIKDGYF